MRGVRLPRSPPCPLSRTHSCACIAELHHVRLPNAHDLKAWDWLCFGPGGDSGEVQPSPAPPKHPAQAVPPPPSPAMQSQQGHSTGCGTSQHEGQWLGQGAGGSTQGHSGQQLGGHGEGQRGEQGVQGPHGAEQVGLGAGASAQGAPVMDQLTGPMLRTVLAMDQVRVSGLGQPFGTSSVACSWHEFCMAYVVITRSIMHIIGHLRDSGPVPRGRSRS